MEIGLRGSYTRTERSFLHVMNELCLDLHKAYYNEIQTGIVLLLLLLIGIYADILVNC